MKKIHSSLNLAEVHNLRNVLATHGIDAEVRGEFRRTAMGEIPINECWIELWLLDDSREEEAQKIIAARDSHPPAAWSCVGCNEPIEGQFASCWNCGEGRPAS